jgi:hypothetical protein
MPEGKTTNDRKAPGKPLKGQAAAVTIFGPVLNSMKHWDAGLIRLLRYQPVRDSPCILRGTATSRKRGRFGHDGYRSRPSRISVRINRDAVNPPKGRQ